MKGKIKKLCLAYGCFLTIVATMVVNTAKAGLTGAELLTESYSVWGGYDGYDDYFQEPISGWYSDSDISPVSGHAENFFGDCWATSSSDFFSLYADTSAGAYNGTSDETAVGTWTFKPLVNKLNAIFDFKFTGGGFDIYADVTIK